MHGVEYVGRCVCVGGGVGADGGESECTVVLLNSLLHVLLQNTQNLYHLICFTHCLYMYVYVCCTGCVVPDVVPDVAPDVVPDVEPVAMDSVT